MSLKQGLDMRVLFWLFECVLVHKEIIRPCKQEQLEEISGTKTFSAILTWTRVFHLFLAILVLKLNVIYESVESINLCWTQKVVFCCKLTKSMLGQAFEKFVKLPLSEFSGVEKAFQRVRGRISVVYFSTEQGGVEPTWEISSDILWPLWWWGGRKVLLI